MPSLKVAYADAVKGVRLPTEQTITLVVAPPPSEVVLRLQLDPSDAKTRDDRFTLKSTDGKYSQQKTPKDDLVAGDGFIDLRFTGLQRHLAYTLEVDPGRDGKPYALFEKIPYRELVNLGPAKDEDAAVGGTSELKVRLAIDPGEAKSKDDRFTLKSSDGKYSQSKTVKDDQTPGDKYVDVTFTGLDTTKDYSLEVDLGKEGRPTLVFENVPFEYLADLSQNVAVDEEPEAKEDGDLRVRLAIDPNDAKSHDDRFTLKSSDGAYSKTLTAKDDQKPGDGHIDLHFTGLATDADYTLEVDFGKEGGPQRVFENVPYADLAELSQNVAPDEADDEPPPAAELKVRLAIDPADAKSKDDRFRLFSDGGWQQVKTVKDDRKPGDKSVDLTFTGLDPRAAYSLEIDPGRDGAKQLVFEKVPYADLSGLSENVPADDVDEPEDDGRPGELRLRVNRDPDDASASDDTFTLVGSDGSRQRKKVGDDFTPGNDTVDLLFKGLKKSETYSLEVDLGAEGGSYHVFENVPFHELAGLSENVPDGLE